MESTQITAISLASLICGTIRISMRAIPRAPRRRAALCALAAVAACASAPPVDVGPVPPEVDVVMSTRYYPVSAATVQDLRAEMSTAGPLAGGRRWAGATQARTRWTFRYLRRGMVCMLHDVRVVVSAEMRLPRWEPEIAPDNEALDWWRGFSARLLEHERGHVQIAVDGAREIANVLRPLEGSVSCDALGMRANGAAQLILVKSRERQAEYDRLTGHGTTQPPAASDSARDIGRP